MPLESRFKSNLIKTIKHLYPGAFVIKTDANETPGIPDNLILFEDRWAMFEAKRSSTSPHQPNQDYYIKVFDDMSYASFVYPQNEEEFLDEIHQALRPRR